MKEFPVLGVLAGGDLPPGRLAFLARLSGFVAAADSAADRLLEEGVRPDLTIGDLDSLSANENRLAEVMRVDEQDSTDADKLLAEIARRGYRRVLLTSVEGDLPDHVLASLQSAAKSTLEVWFSFRRGFGKIVRSGPASVVVTSPGGRVSLIPLASCTGVQAEGLEWPITNGTLDPLGGSGISNRASGVSARVAIGSGALLVFVESAGEPISALVSSFKGP